MLRARATGQAHLALWGKENLLSCYSCVFKLKVWSSTG